MIYYFKYRLTSQDPDGPKTLPGNASDLHEARNRAIGTLAFAKAIRGEGYCEIFDKDPETGADPIDTVLW